MNFKNTLVTAVVAALVIIFLGKYAYAADEKYYLEKAVRMQTLIPIALERGDYSTACKAQEVVALSLAKANSPKDVVMQASKVHADICSMSWDRDWQTSLIADID